jgi:predicted Zn finger-like uncharacterized protein
MRITCPACHATYDVPAAMLARAPARVRCARCAEEWAPEELQAAAAPPPATPQPAPPATATPFADALVQAAAQTAPPLEPIPAPPDTDRTRLAVPPRPELPRPEAPRPEPIAPRHRPAAAPRSPRDSTSLLFAWSLSIGVVAALLAAAYIRHAEVVAFWPPAERAYMLLGLQ